MAKVIRIGTHDGIFHCDEVLACFLLKKLPEFSGAEIVRSRDDKVLDTCDLVVDVGAVYDPSKHRYDHHQKEFNHTMKSLAPGRPWDIRLSSAGLVYHHFGEKIIKSIVNQTLDSKQLSSVFNYLYENFVQEIDGIDNGVPMFDGPARYKINTNLSSRIATLNPTWNETQPKNSNLLFQEAMEVVGKEFLDRLNYFMESLWPAKKIVEDAINNRFNSHESGEIIELSTACPWKDHVYQLEEEEGLIGTIKFAIFQDRNAWRVCGLPVESGSFICRQFLNSDWWGLRGDKLCEVSKIPKCIFVHSTGFIGGNETKEGAISMAVKSLKSKSVP